MVVQGIEEGTFDGRVHPSVVANTLTSILNATRSWYRRSGRLSPGEIHDWYVTLFVRGLAPPG